MKKIFLLVFIFFVSSASLSFALEWKSIHEEADKMNLAAALEGVKERPESVNDLYRLGLVYLNLHKDKEARETFDRILAIEPKTIEAKWGKAEVLRREHDIKKSQEFINEVIKENPLFAPAYITLAYLKYRQMDFNEAVRLANEVLKMGEDKVDQSNHVRAHLILAGAKGMIAHYGGPFSKAINGTSVMPNLKRAQKMQPDSAGVAFGLGSFYLLAPGFAGGNLNKAEEYLKKAITLDPLFADAYVRLGQLYKIKGDNVKYKDYLNKALEIDPQNELALDIKSGQCKFICTAGEN